MILLNDILGLSDDDIKNTKIRLNKNNNEDFEPIKFYKEKNNTLYKGNFWNGKSKRFQEGEIVIGFIRISDDKWLLFDISIITKDLNVYNNMGYEYETIEKYKKFFGRVIIRYKNKGQQMVRMAEGLINEFEIYEIIDETFDDDVFPGYENVDLSWYELKKVIEKKDWKTALENQKGIYLITDTHTGKRYVGSAYGENMLLGRWRNYVDSGHGGNKELKTLSFEYIKNNFRYSLLEIYKSTIEDRIIIKREHFWMRILLTKNKNFGYNN